MIKQYGADAIAKMLAAYADNLSTAEALRRSFDVSQADFETGYRGHVEQIVAALPKTTRQREMSLDEVRKQLAKSPNDPELLARLALDHLKRKNYGEARRQADASLAVDPKQQLAHYVRARLHLLVGENREALKRLESALDRQHPQENLLSLLAGLKLKSEDYSAAAELYALGREHDPTSAQWLKSLAAVYLKSSDPRLAEVLTELAARDPDDFAVRKKLAQLAAASNQSDAVLRWTLEALHIDVRDPAIHQWRAEALVASNSPKDAADEYERAAILSPDDLALRLALAQACVKAAQPERAKAALEKLLKHDADYPGARQLLESLR
jgi:predicted Zn-dependent protease